MEHCVDENLRVSGFIEYGVREATEKGPTHRAVHKLVGFRVSANRCEAGADSSEKLVGALVALPVIPGVRLIQVKLCLRSET
jgi:hypothetical protein